MVVFVLVVVIYFKRFNQLLLIQPTINAQTQTQTQTQTQIHIFQQDYRKVT